MSTKSLRAYTFSSVYLGDAAPASGVLTKVSNIRTGGNDFVDSTPTTYIPHLGIKVMSGPQQISLAATFYDKSTNDLTKLVAKGISVSGTFSSISSLQTYSLLLVAPDEEAEDSYWIPKINTDIRYEQAFRKDGGLVVPVQFSISANDLSTILYYKDTVANLVTEMGARSPL